MARMSTAPHTLTGTHSGSGNGWEADHHNERMARLHLVMAIVDNGYGCKEYATTQVAALKLGEPTVILHQRTGAPALSATIYRTI